MFITLINGNPKENTLDLYYIMKFDAHTKVGQLTDQLILDNKGQTYIHVYKPGIEKIEPHINHSYVRNMLVKDYIIEMTTDGIYPVFLFKSNTYKLLPLEPILLPKIPRILDKWLVFGVGHTDYWDWKVYSNTNDVQMEVLALDNYQDVIPKKELWLGDFNDLSFLNKLPDNTYQKILFARGVVDAIKWSGQHIGILIGKLKSQGELLIPDARAKTANPFEKWTSFNKLLVDIDNMRKTDVNIPDGYKLIYSNNRYKELHTTEYEYLSLLISGYSPRIIYDSNNISINEIFRNKADKFYRNENRNLLTHYFNKIDYIEDGNLYPKPDLIPIYVRNFWRLSNQ